MSPNTIEVGREIVIEPRTGWRLVDLGELGAYRDLLWNLTWRNVKGRYAQSALAVGWVLVQPLAMLAIFTVVFGRVVGIEVPGGAPYSLFAFCGLVPWLFFSTSLVGASNSLVSESYILTKVYFPRLILPLSNVLARLIDLGAMLAILGGMMVWFGFAPRPSAAWMLPVLIVTMTACVLGLGLWLSAMAVQYRDVAHALSLITQLWMYATPVFYPESLIPAKHRLLYGLNPMVGVIAGFRSCLLGEPSTPWDLMGLAMGVSLCLLVTGTLYFRRSERLFADVA